MCCGDVCVCGYLHACVVLLVRAPNSNPGLVSHCAADAAGRGKRSKGEPAVLDNVFCVGDKLRVLLLLTFLNGGGEGILSPVCLVHVMFPSGKQSGNVIKSRERTHGEKARRQCCDGSTCMDVVLGPAD